MPSDSPANSPDGGPAIAPVYRRLRQQVLDLDPADIGLAAGDGGPRVWAALMELGLPEAVVTLVSVGDGATSLYFSNGGGVIGGGETAAVAAATLQFLATAEGLLAELAPTDEFPLPAPGQVLFYALTHDGADGAYTAGAAEEELQSRQQALMPLYAMGQNVITQLRLRAEGQE